MKIGLPSIERQIGTDWMRMISVSQTVQFQTLLLDDKQLHTHELLIRRLIPSKDIRLSPRYAWLPNTTCAKEPPPCQRNLHQLYPISEPRSLIFSRMITLSVVGNYSMSFNHISLELNHATRGLRKRRRH